MVTPSKIRQKKWKEKQKDKKQVTVMISKAAYSNMSHLKSRTRENYSQIIERAISNLTNPANIPGTRSEETAGELTKHSERLEELIRAIRQSVSG